MKKCSLTISGGGMRSTAGLGVIKRIEELNYEIISISGTSGGSIIALLYAYGLTVNEIENFIDSLNKYKIFKPTLKSLFSLNYLEEELNKIIKDKELKIRLVVCVTNLKTGKPEYIEDKKNIVKYVIASSSLIPFFKPIKINNILYADGGYTDNMPVEPFKDSLETKISINVNNMYGNKLLRNLAFIVMNSNIRYSIEKSDIFVNIDNLEGMNLFDFKKMNFAIKQGYKKAKELL